VLVPAQAGDAAYAACLRLFRHYPLAVRRHYAERRYGSMVLMGPGPGAARFFVLTMEWDDLFLLRPWDRRDGARVRIARDDPGPAGVRRLIESSVPVPRDGALLGWVADGQVRAVLVAYGRLPEPWDDPAAVPGILVLPRSGSGWPASGRSGGGRPGRPEPAGNPLDGGWLWEQLRRGELADLAPLVARHAERVFWVPGPARAGRPAGARIVVTERISDDEFWLPAGVYARPRPLRPGTPVLTASQLLALPGVTDLAGGSSRPYLLGV
jgi:hypothetical protein